MTPTFTVLIGSCGRETLKDSLDSVYRQARCDGDQVIVAFDANEKSDEWIAEKMRFVKDYGPGFDTCAYVGRRADGTPYSWFGIEQINYAMRTLEMTGSHILTIGDDDVYVDGAFAALRRRCQIAPSRSVLFRFVAPWRELLWEVKQMRMSRISGCCGAFPKQYVEPFPTREYVEHDFDWMQGILSRAPHIEPDWWDKVLVIARPDRRTDGTTVHRGIIQCWHCKDWRWLEDVDPIKQPKCPKCRVVIDFPGLEVAPLGWGRPSAGETEARVSG